MPGKTKHSKHDSAVHQSQVEDVLRWLREKPLTQAEATKHLGVMRLPSRINDLRKRFKDEGRYAINTERVAVRTRFGKRTHIGRYHLIKIGRGAA